LPNCRRGNSLKDLAHSRRLRWPGGRLTGHDGGKRKDSLIECVESSKLSVEFLFWFKVESQVAERSSIGRKDGKIIQGRLSWSKVPLIP
jgi:hypothetical protein